MNKKILFIFLINCLIINTSEKSCKAICQKAIPTCLRTSMPYGLASAIGMGYKYGDLPTLFSDSGSDAAAEQFEEFPAKCLIPATILGTALFTATDYGLYLACHKQPNFGVFCGSACMNITLNKTKLDEESGIVARGRQIKCCRCNCRESAKSIETLDEINRLGVKKYSEILNEDIGRSITKLDQILESVRVISSSLPAEPIIERADEVTSPIENAATPRASLFARCAGSIRRIFRKSSGSNDGTATIALLPTAPIMIDAHFAQPIDINSASSSRANTPPRLGEESQRSHMILQPLLSEEK